MVSSAAVEFSLVASSGEDSVVRDAAAESDEESELMFAAMAHVIPAVSAMTPTSAAMMIPIRLAEFVGAAWVGGRAPAVVSHVVCSFARCGREGARRINSRLTIGTRGTGSLPNRQVTGLVNAVVREIGVARGD